jgi:hypothetical protein
MPHVRLDPITADPRVHHLPEREVRLARVEVKPSAVADLIEVFGDSAVSWLAEPLVSAAPCCSPTRVRVT